MVLFYLSFKGDMYFNFAYVCVVASEHVYGCPQRSELLEMPRVGVRRSCELPDEGAWKGIQIPCKNRTHSWFLQNLSSIFFIFLLHLFIDVYVCACVYDYVCMHTGIYMGMLHVTAHVDRGQSTACDSSSCLLYGSLGLNSGPQTWEQVPSLAEPIPRPEKVSF